MTVQIESEGCDKIPRVESILKSRDNGSTLLIPFSIEKNKNTNTNKKAVTITSQSNLNLTFYASISNWKGHS